MTKKRYIGGMYYQTPFSQPHQGVTDLRNVGLRQESKVPLLALLGEEHRGDR